MARRVIPHTPDINLASTVLAVGEVVFAETSKEFRVGDGVTTGGIPLVKDGAAVTAAQLDAVRGLLNPTAADDIVPQGGFFPVLANTPGFRALGDSQTSNVSPSGIGTITTATTWRELVADRLGVSHTNNAISGGQVMDWGKLALQNSISEGDFAMILPGYNDLRANGEDATKLEAYRLALMANTAWLAIPNVWKRTGSDLITGGTTTGTWAAVTAPGYAGAITSSTAGSTITFESEGATVYIAGLSISVGGGSFTLTVDGEPHTFTCARTVGNGGAVSSDNYAPALFRVPDLGDGKHTWTLTVVGDGAVFVHWVAGSNLHGTEGATVLLGNTLRMMAASAPLGAPYNHYTEKGQQLYSKAAEQVVRELASDGLSVMYVDAAGTYDPDTMTSSDGIHMNQTGQNGVAAAFINALDLRKSYAAAAAGMLGARRRPENQVFAPFAALGGTTTGTTPVWSRGTVSNNKGQVTVTGDVRFGKGTATGALAILGGGALPPPRALPGDASLVPVVFRFYSGFAAGVGVNGTGYIDGNGNIVEIADHTGNLTDASLGADTRLFFTASYLAAQ